MASVGDIKVNFEAAASEAATTEPRLANLGEGVCSISESFTRLSEALGTAATELALIRSTLPELVEVRGTIRDSLSRSTHLVEAVAADSPGTSAYETLYMIDHARANFQSGTVLLGLSGDARILAEGAAHVTALQKTVGELQEIFAPDASISQTIGTTQDLVPQFVDKAREWTNTH